MKTNTTIKTERRAQEQSEQVFTARQPQVAKYIILQWQGREQVTVFPFGVKHADVFAYIRQECGDVLAISAGFYCNEPEGFWCGGESDTLNLKSRPQDRELLQSFFASSDRRAWDLNLIAAEAALAGAN